MKKHRQKLWILLAFLSMFCILTGCDKGEPAPIPDGQGAAGSVYDGALEAWTLGDGGTAGTAASELEGGTRLSHTWGVWLPNTTFGQSLDFSTEGACAFSDSTKINFGGDFAVSVWFQAPAREALDRTLLMQGGEGETGGARLYLDAENDFALTFEADGVTGLESSGAGLADGQWHHVLVSRSGDSFTYYVDGEAVKTLTVSGKPASSSTALFVGSDTAHENGFDGTLAELRIYGQAKTPEETTTVQADVKDNRRKKPRLDLKKGLVIDRRQYHSPEPGEDEGQTVREQDIVNTKNMGFDHVKLLLTPNHLIAEDGSLIKENMFYIDRVMQYVVDNGYQAILCIHPEDKFKATYLGNLDNFEKLVKWYGELAAYIGERWDADTLALQLMTEPGDNNPSVSWSWMSDRMWGAVRNVLPEHTIITSSNFWGNLEMLKQMSPAGDTNLIYSFTTYEPYTIGWYYYSTNYGILDAWSYIKNIPYPVEEGVDYTDAIEASLELVPESLKAQARKELTAYVKGEYDGKRPSFENKYDSLYNAKWHMLRAQSLDEWRDKYGGNIHIMCVEFGCMDSETPRTLWKTSVEGAGIPEKDRLQFVRDMRSSFDTYNIGWSYWSYNEAHTIFQTDKHVYGQSPSAETAPGLFDYNMLEYGLGVTPLVTKPEDDPNKFVIDPVEELGGWIGTGLAVKADPARNGAAYLESSSRDAGGASVFFTGLNKMDLSRFAKDGYLHLWVYIEDVSKLTGGQIEITSSGSPDMQETSWNATDWVKQSGWNELYLPVAYANSEGGKTDFSRVNCMRVFFLLSGDTRTGIDEIYMTLTGDGKKPPVVKTSAVSKSTSPAQTDPSKYVIDTMDNIGGWIGTDIRRSTDGPKQGKAYLSSNTRDEYGSAVFSAAFSPMNLKKFENGYLHLWVYIEDVTKLAGGQIEMTSSGTCDLEETSWNIADWVTQSGWTELYLPVARANQEGGKTDFSKVDCMRIYFSLTEKTRVGLDDLYMCSEDGNAAPPAEESGDYVIDAIDQVSPWYGSVITAGKTDPPTEGGTYLESSLAAAGDTVFFRTFPAMDLSAYDKTGALRLWIYVDDVSKLIGGQAELTSSGVADEEELSWNLTDWITKSGWTELTLPMSSAARVGGDIDLTRVSCMRVYFQLSAGGVTRIDDIRMTLQGVEASQPYSPPQRDGTVIDEIEGVAPWYGSLLSLGRDNPPEPGGAYIKTTLATAGDAVFFRTFDPMDLSAYKDNGYLHIWVYVEDVTKLLGGQVELTSSGVADDKEISWELKQWVKSSGWNELVLPVQSASRVGGAMDFAAVNCMRVYFQLSGGGTTAIDGIYMTQQGAGQTPGAPSGGTGGNGGNGGGGDNGGGTPQQPDPDRYVIDEMTSVGAWIGTGITVMTEGSPTGAAYLTSNSRDEYGSAVFSKGFSSMDLRAWSSGYLHLWVYIEDHTKLAGGQIELTSSGTCDLEETSWNLIDWVTRSGWTELYLPVSGANHEGGYTDFSRVNCMRIYFSLPADTRVSVGRISMSKTDGETPDPNVFVIDAIDRVTPWYGTVITAGTANPAIPGSTYLESALSAAGDTVFFRIFSPMDLSRFSSAGELQLWVYVDDVSKLLGGQVELTSAGVSDQKEISWNLSDYITASGWTRLTLPVRDANHMGGEIDFSAVDCMRVYFQMNAGGVTRIDDISIRLPADAYSDAVEAWPLNDGGAGAALASSLMGGTAASQTWGVWLPSHTFGKALDFSTEGSYALSQNAKADFSGDFAVSVWLQAPVREDNDRTILMQGVSGARLYLDESKNFELTFEAPGITGLTGSGVGLADGRWHHVLISRSGNTFTYYIDKTPVKTLTVSGSHTAASRDLYIGADASRENGLDGSLAQLRIFNKAKTPAEATAVVLDSRDNTSQNPRLNLKKGLVIDRRQYHSPEPGESEGQTVREQDIINTKNMGFDHVKLLLTPNHLIDGNGSLIEANMFYIDRVMQYVVDNNYKAILCIHPEGDFKTTYLGNLQNFEKLIKWYGELAAYIGGKWGPDTLALQLMTEPAEENQTVSWSWMSDRMWGAVRNVLPDHTIITSSNAYGNLEKLKAMSPAGDPNLIYSFTTYEPYTIGWYYYSFSQGVEDAWNYIRNIPYPVEEGKDYSAKIEAALKLVPENLKAQARTELTAYVNGDYDGKRPSFENDYDSLYNAGWHELRAESLDDWSEKYGGNIHMMCVEFGCMDRLTPVLLWDTAVPDSGIPRADRLQFVYDMRRAFEEYNIGWSYWSYNEAHTILLPETHLYGDSPSPENAVAMFDYDMLVTGLNVAPLVEKPDTLVVDSIETTDDWEISGAVMAADRDLNRAYLQNTLTGAGDAVFFRYFNPALNLSRYANGELRLWIYVDDIAKFNGGQLELTSTNGPDDGEISWDLKNRVKKSGWNELILPIAGANRVEPENTADLTDINYLRLYLHMTGAAVTGIDHISVSNVRVIDSIDRQGDWYGGPTLTAERITDPAWSTGLMNTLDAPGDAVFCRNFDPMDLSAFSDGTLRLRVYVDDISKFNGGAVELTSSGAPDAEEISWSLAGSVTHSGWNELTLPMNSTEKVGEIKLEEVDFMRVYIHMSSSGRAGLDDIRVGNGLTSAYAEAVEQAGEDSLIYAGGENNKAAIANVLKMAQDGDPVTLVTFGDSITAGAVAPAGQEWASLLHDWLEGLNPAENVTLVNAGIGSTEAVFGVSRVEKDVLSQDPDLVIVDFGTNDYGLPHAQEAYEGILTKLLSNGVPVINLNICPRSGNNIQELQKPVNENYGVPQISFKSAYHALSKTTGIAGLREADIWSADDVHPLANGHKLAADLLIRYLNKEILEQNIAPAAQSTTLPSPLTANGFADAVLLENTDTHEGITVTPGSWTPDYSARIYQLSTEGWQTTAFDSTLKFEVEAGYFQMFFALTPQSGDLEIKVDGHVTSTITYAHLGTGYMNPYHILHLPGAGSHTVELTLRENANVADPWFGICAVSASNFSGSGGGPDPDPEPGRRLLDAMDAVGGWIPSHLSTRTIAARNDDPHPGGGAYLETTGTNIDDRALFHTKVSESLNLSAYEDGYLHLWVYVDDIDKLITVWENGGGEIALWKDPWELVRSWTFKDYVTQSGWTELYLPLSGTPGGLGQIDYIQISAHFHDGKEGTFRADDIEVCATKP